MMLPVPAGDCRARVQSDRIESVVSFHVFPEENTQEKPHCPWGKGMDFRGIIPEIPAQAHPCESIG